MVIIYTRDGCAYCEQAKKMMQQQGESYLEYKIGEQVDRQYVLDLVEMHSIENTLPVVKLPTGQFGNYNQLLDYLYPPMATGQEMD